MSRSAALDDATARSLRDPLFAFIRRRVADRAIAEDMVQEVLLKLWAALPTLEDDQRLRPFAYRIARNAIADHYRARQRLDPLDDEDLPAFGDDADPDENDNALVGAWLRGFIDLLPTEKREAVWLADVEGLKQREVAERLGLSLSGAKSRVQRGRAELRDLLEACCRVETDRRGNAIDWRKRDDCC